MTNLSEMHRRGEYGPCGNPQCDLTGHEWGPYTQWHRVWLCASCLLTAQRAEKEILVNRELTQQMSDHLDEQGYPPLQDNRLTGHVNWATLGQMDDKADWLLEPVIPRNRMIAMFAPAGEGKSELTLHMALCAATGRDLHGNTGLPPIVTAYFDFEQNLGILRDRVVDLGYDLDTDNLENLHYYMHADLPPLDTASGGEAIREEITDVAAALVFIDTTSRVLSGPENDADTLRDFNHHTGSPLIADNRTVFRLDHAGKDLKQGQRGTSAKADVVDLIWQQMKREDATRLIGRKRRDSWVPLEVDLDRVETLDKITYRLSSERTWGPRTKEIAEQLDTLGVDRDAGRGTAGKALRGIGVKVRDRVITEALEYRRASSGPVPHRVVYQRATETGTGTPEPLETKGGTGAGTGGHTPPTVIERGGAPLRGTPPLTDDEIPF